MIGIILTIFLLPGAVEAQTGCDTEALIRCINNFTDSIFTFGDISNPARLTASQQDGLCRTRYRFESCIGNLPGCGMTDIVRRTVEQVYNATRIDLQELCGEGTTTRKMMTSTYPPWRSTNKPWGTTTHRHGQGCTTMAIEQCMQNLRWSFDPNEIDTKRICPLAVQAVGCLNRLISCMESNSMEYNNAVGWIDQFDLIRLCDIIVFPVSKGAAINSFPLLTIVGLLGAVIALI